MIAIRDLLENCYVPRSDRSADGELKLASFGSSWKSLRPQKMLKHLLLYSIITNFIGALGVLNFSKDTLQVPMIAVTPERLGFVHLRPLTGRWRLFPSAASCHSLRILRFLGVLAFNRIFPLIYILEVQSVKTLVFTVIIT